MPIAGSKSTSAPAQANSKTATNTLETTAKIFSLLCKQTCSLGYPIGRYWRFRRSGKIGAMQASTSARSTRSRLLLHPGSFKLLAA